MKLAALQLMQQKASKLESPTSLENGGLPSPESKPEDPPGPEAGSEEEGSNASGLAKVKELAETIASDDGTGGAAVDAEGSPRPVLAAGACWGWLTTQPLESQADVSSRSCGRLGAAWPHRRWSGLPPSRPCLHSRPSESGGDPQRMQGSRLHQQHSL